MKLSRTMAHGEVTPFKELSFSEKLQYIITYYGPMMIIALIVAAVIGSCVYFYILNDFDSRCNILAVDGKLSGYDDHTDAITTGFTSHLGLDGKKERVVIDYNNSLIVRPLDQDAAVTRTKIITKASVGDIDGYMASEDYITYFSTDVEPFLYDLRELLTIDELAAIGKDNLVYYSFADNTSIPVAVKLTDTIIATDTNLTMSNPCYGIVVTAPNYENAAEFIRYAYQLD